MNGECGVLVSFKDEFCTSEYASQLNWDWKACKSTSIFTKDFRAILTENVHSGLQKHMTFVYLHALFSCIISFHVCTNVCFHLMSNVQIVRTFENWIPTETFEKWHQKSYRCVSYVKSEASHIWRTVAWFLKPFGERVEENHKLQPSKTEFYSKN